MTLQTGIILIEGDRRNDLAVIFGAYNYIDQHLDQTVDGWRSALDICTKGSTQTIQQKGIGFANGWTVILDPEMVLMALEDECMGVSTQLNARIVGIVSERLSGMRGFKLIDATVVRSILVIDGNIAENIGDPLPEETGIGLTALSEDNLLILMQRFGVSLDDLTGPFLIKTLGDDAPTTAPTGTPALKPAAKPWWKFW